MGEAQRNLVSTQGWQTTAGSWIKTEYENIEEHRKKQPAEDLPVGNI
jgi:hypothetical protein